MLTTLVVLVIAVASSGRVVKGSWKQKEVKSKKPCRSISSSLLTSERYLETQVR